MPEYLCETVYVKDGEEEYIIDFDLGTETPICNDNAQPIDGEEQTLDCKPQTL